MRNTMTDMKDSIHCDSAATPDNADDQTRTVTQPLMSQDRPGFSTSQIESDVGHNMTMSMMTPNHMSVQDER